MALDQAARADAARVRDAYARRDKSSRESAFDAAHLFMVQDQERAVLACLKRHAIHSLGGLRILEIGCGTGRWVRELVQWGAEPRHVVGVDLLEGSIVAARDRCPPGVALHVGNATRLPFRDASFDLVLQSTVFTSILDARIRAEVASEMLRVMRPSGLILWYDFVVSNPRNPDVRGVPTREIRQLFPGCRISMRRLTLAPPLVRAIAPWSRPLCSVLNAVPALRTHVLAAIGR